ncbi:hypothetical protein SALBM135S_10195 [Streptomyces alboniger]
MADQLRAATEALVCCTHLGTPVLPEVSRLMTGVWALPSCQRVSASCRASDSTSRTRTVDSFHSARTSRSAGAVAASVRMAGCSSRSQALRSLRLVSLCAAYVVATATGVGTNPPSTHAQNAVM